MKVGEFLHASPLLNESIFEEVIIFITEHNEKGAMGFVVNKPFSRGLTELEEFKNGQPFPLFEGGPVDQEHLFFVHQRPDLISGGTQIHNDVYYGGDFTTAVAHINKGTLTGKDIKIFIGYCGWDNTELEAEIEEGSWTLTDTGEIFI